MSRKRNHAMAARQRVADPMAAARVIGGLRKPTLDQALLLAERMHLAVDAVARGGNDAHDWGTIVDVLNMVDALVHLGRLDGRDEVLRLMGVVTVLLQRRAERPGQPVAFHAAELADLRALAAVWAEVAPEQPLHVLGQAEAAVVARSAKILAQLGKTRREAADLMGRFAPRILQVSMS